LGHDGRTKRTGLLNALRSSLRTTITVYLPRQAKPLAA
jgi:hypothetical protein